MPRRRARRRAATDSGVWLRSLKSRLGIWLLLDGLGGELAARGPHQPDRRGLTPGHLLGPAKALPGSGAGRVEVEGLAPRAGATAVRRIPGVDAARGQR